MTNPTIHPQQPEPERVCANCEFYCSSQDYNDRGVCIQSGDGMSSAVRESDTCVLFRAREES